mmetsp:Transcript_5694/g.8031  ORF Transcript_5694/g.8031 Transcript_5694/m.8031 type:complete len:81 (-) Transcript_5694:499-741(-)
MVAGCWISFRVGLDMQLRLCFQTWVISVLWVFGATPHSKLFTKKAEMVAKMALLGTDTARYVFEETRMASGGEKLLGDGL